VTTTTAHEQTSQLVGELGIGMLVAVGTDCAQAPADAARHGNPALTAEVAADPH